MSTAAAATSSQLMKCQSIFDYIETLPRENVLRLYGDESRGKYACKAVLQRLPDLARQYVFRLAACGGEFPQKDVDKWHSVHGSKEAAESIKRMEALHIVEAPKRRRTDDEDEVEEVSKEADMNDNKTLKMTAEYLSGITKCVTTLESSPWPEVSPTQQASWLATAKANKSSSARDHNHKSSSKYSYSPPPSHEELDLYTQKRWDSVLHFLVGSDTGDTDDPPAAVEHFLKITGLMQDDPDWVRSHFQKSPSVVITSKGYEFMLREHSSQLWQFILQYLNALQNHRECDLIKTEALLFLICLSFCRIGTAYPVSCLGAYSKTHSSSRTTFYPTKAAVNLLASSVSNDPSTSSTIPSATTTRTLEFALSLPIPPSSHIAIIVQTNFQLCAYTTSSLHVAMLGLFCEVSTFRRLPNVIFFKISRDSVKSAFRLGITALQIIQFLKMHAHPKLRTGDQPLLPPNVRDQILLWDRERSRVSLQEVYTLQCHTKEEFQSVQRYALDNESHAWSNAAKQTIMLKYEDVKKIMSFLRRWRSRGLKRASGQLEDRGGDEGAAKSAATARRVKQRQSGYT